MDQLPRLVLTTLHRDFRQLQSRERSPLAHLWWRIRTVDRQIGGVQVQTEAFRSSMEAAGHHVVLLTPFDGFTFTSMTAAALGVPLRLFPRWSERWRVWWHDTLLRASLRRSRALLDGSTPTIVLAQCGLSAAAAQRYRDPTVPVVVVAH